MKTEGLYEGVCWDNGRFQIHKAFEVHKLNEVGIQKAQTIAKVFDALLYEIGILVPPGREFSIVTDHLEAASFFAKKGMSSQKENQQ